MNTSNPFVGILADIHEACMQTHDQLVARGFSDVEAMSAISSTVQVGADLNRLGGLAHTIRALAREPASIGTAPLSTTEGNPMNPVIRTLTVSPSTIKPGETATVTVDAFDPDSRTVTATAEVADAAGNIATATTLLTVGDPLEFQLATDDPTVTVVADPQRPGVFHLSVPA